MTPWVRWAGPAVGLAGVAAIALAARQGAGWAVLGALGGVVATLGALAARGVLRRRTGATAPPTDFAHALDLVRRAHGGRAAWAVGLDAGDLEATDGSARPSRTLLERGASLVQLASADGRTHVVREDEGTYVAVGDFPHGAGVLLRYAGPAPATLDAAAYDLRRLLAAIQVAERQSVDSRGPARTRQLLAHAVAGAQTLDGVARAGAEVAQRITQRGAVIVVQEPAPKPPRVVAVSSGADRRLLDFTPGPDAPVVRALQLGLPVVAERGEDVFGTGVAERRRSERSGTAYPLLDGRMVIGALVVLGAPVGPATPVAEQIGLFLVELGPRLATARAVHHAEQLAVRDPLTDLVNRRELVRALERFSAETVRQAQPATLIYVDLDRFKSLNDTLGHTAGDSALRHVADLLRAQIRDRDVAARIGGEEFAVWLPRTPLREGLEVAERIRAAVEETAWWWGGRRYPLTTSCGVASYPDGVGDVRNLATTADAALYRAKQGGRNRVEAAVEKPAQAG